MAGVAPQCGCSEDGAGKRLAWSVATAPSVVRGHQLGIQPGSANDRARHMQPDQPDEGPVSALFHRGSVSVSRMPSRPSLRRIARALAAKSGSLVRLGAY